MPTGTADAPCYLRKREGVKAREGYSWRRDPDAKPDQLESTGGSDSATVGVTFSAQAGLI